MKRNGIPVVTSITVNDVTIGIEVDSDYLYLPFTIVDTAINPPRIGSMLYYLRISRGILRECVKESSK